MQGDDKFIGIDEVAIRVNRKRSTIYSLMKKKKFPIKYKNGWLLSEVLAYMENIVNAEKL
jgi:predicted DNA-binding transcriptional regulator AlpA